VSAQKILGRLEENNKMPIRKREFAIQDRKHQQLPLFKDQQSPVLKKLDEKDIMEMTPLDAMNFLYKLKQDLKAEEKTNG